MKNVKKSLTVLACASVFAVALTSYGISTWAEDAPPEPVRTVTEQSADTPASTEPEAKTAGRVMSRKDLRVDLIPAEEAPPESYNGFLALDETPIAQAMSGTQAAECILDQYEKAMRDPYKRLDDALSGRKFDRVGIQISYGFSQRLNAYAWTGLVYSARDGQLENGEDCTFQTVVYACSIDAVTGKVYKEDFEGDFILPYDVKAEDAESEFRQEAVRTAEMLSPDNQVKAARMLWNDHDQSVGIGVTLADGSGYCFYFNTRHGVHQLEYFPDGAKMY